MDREKVVWYIGGEPLVLKKTGNKKRSKSTNQDQNISELEEYRPLTPDKEELYNSILNCLGLSNA